MAIALYAFTWAIAFFACIPFFVHASPWLEANDPYLRSDLQLLADAQSLDTPVNTFPLRWSAFGDALSYKKAATYSFDIANRQLNYALNSVRLQRGNRSFRVFYANNELPNQGFGLFTNEEWGSYASYEHLQGDYAFRVSSGYSKNNDKEKFRWNESYIAFRQEDLLVSLGQLDRWWGQGWQHNLILGSSASSTPELSVSYENKAPFIGYWALEALVGLPEDSVVDNHQALRFTSKPLSFWEFGITYQTWSDGVDLSTEDKQSAFDAKLSLPTVNDLYHSIYAEVASSNKSSRVGAWMLGWSGQFSILKQSIRLVLEHQQQTDNGKKSKWKQKQYPHTSEGNYRNTYIRDNSYSFAAYTQFNNDHKLSFIYQNFEIPSTLGSLKTKARTGQASFRIPALAGMVHIGVGFSDINTRRENNIWSGYEFRF